MDEGFYREVILDQEHIDVGRLHGQRGVSWRPSAI